MTKPKTGKKMVSVMLTDSLHRKVKVMAELEGKSLSSTIEEILEALVKRRLPKLIAGMDAEETTEVETPVAAE